MKKTFVLLEVIIVISVMILMSCNKQDNGSFSAAHVNSTTNLTYTLAPNGDVSGLYNGVLVEEYFAPPYTSSSADAFFYNSPTAFHWSSVTFGHVTPATGTVTSVYVNNVKLRFSPIDMDYQDSTNTLTFPPAKWVINSGSVIPSFTYNCYTAIPSYTTMSNLPTTINRSQDLTIFVGGSGYDQIEVDLDSGGRSLCMYSSSSSSSITFPKDSLAKLTAGNGGIDVTLIKYNPQALGTKNFLFLTTTNYSKSGVTIQ